MGQQGSKTYKVRFKRHIYVWSFKEGTVYRTVTVKTKGNKKSAISKARNTLGSGWTYLSIKEVPNG